MRRRWRLRSARPAGEPRPPPARPAEPSPRLNAGPGAALGGRCCCPQHGCSVPAARVPAAAVLGLPLPAHPRRPLLQRRAELLQAGPAQGSRPEVRLAPAQPAPRGTAARTPPSGLTERNPGVPLGWGWAGTICEPSIARARGGGSPGVGSPGP